MELCGDAANLLVSRSLLQPGCRSAADPFDPQEERSVFQRVRNGIVMTLLLSSVVVTFVSVSQAQSAAEIFDKNCALCHGKDGASKTAAATRMVIPDLRSREVQQLSEEQIFETIAYGTGHKQYPHAFVKRGMAPATVHEMVAHIRELAKAKK